MVEKLASAIGELEHGLEGKRQRIYLVNLNGEARS